MTGPSSCHSFAGVEWRHAVDMQGRRNHAGPIRRVVQIIQQRLQRTLRPSSTASLRARLSFLVAVLFVMMLFSRTFSPSMEIHPIHTETIPGTTLTSRIFKHPQFVFLMGTEGSGHHFWAQLIFLSPNMKVIENMNLLSEAENITYQLFDKRDQEHSLFLGAPCSPQWNGARLIEQTARRLRDLADKLPSGVTVPLNGIPSTKVISGMISYPNLKSGSKCAGFRHADVDLLQQACDEAQVTCHYVLQYRDPLAVLRSTVITRHMHSMGYAIPMYTSMLSILRNQLSQLPESALEFCWNYDSPKAPVGLGKLLGWENEKEFSAFFERKFKPTVGNFSSKIVPNEYAVLLRSLLAAHEELKKMCRERGAL